jgi:hypothetical protein
MLSEPESTNSTQYEGRHSSEVAHAFNANVDGLLIIHIHREVFCLTKSLKQRVIYVDLKSDNPENNDEQYYSGFDHVHLQSLSEFDAQYTFGTAHTVYIEILSTTFALVKTHLVSHKCGNGTACGSAMPPWPPKQVTGLADG